MTLMTPHKQQPQQSQQEHYELLKELPRDILERILLQYCDGKSLSTLALVCSTTKDSQSMTAAFYHRDVYAMICSVYQSVIQQIRQDIQSSQAAATVVKKKYGSDIQSNRDGADWLLQWTQDLLNSTGGDVQQGLVLDLSTIQRHGIVNDSEQRQQPWDSAPTLASLCATQTPLRRLSENLAAVDFLRRRGLHYRYHISTFAPTWDEWPLWAGPIAIDYYTGSTGNFTRVTVQVKMMQCGHSSCFDSSFPDAALVNRRFRAEPANFLPSQQWAHIVGLTPADDDCLRCVARNLDEQDQVAILTANMDGALKIFSKRQARRRYDMAPPFFRRHIEPRMLNPRRTFSSDVRSGACATAPATATGNTRTTDNASATASQLEAAAEVAAPTLDKGDEDDVNDGYPLICCWDRDDGQATTTVPMDRMIDLLRQLEQPRRHW